MCNCSFHLHVRQRQRNKGIQLDWYFLQSAKWKSGGLANSWVFSLPADQTVPATENDPVVCCVFTSNTYQKLQTWSTLHQQCIKDFLWHITFCTERQDHHVPCDLIAGRQFESIERETCRGGQARVVLLKWLKMFWFLSLPVCEPFRFEMNEP